MSALEVKHLSVSFGGLKAVQDVSLTLPEGSLHALIGPNGAGKTTFFALVSGFVRPDSGQVNFWGEDITAWPAHERSRVGLTRTFQIVQPFAAQSVGENIAVGAHLHCANRRDALLKAREIAKEVGLLGLFDRRAGELTVAARKRLELARALATSPRLLLLDEVLAGLNPQEIQDILPVITRLCDQGLTILMIEHVMQAVMRLAQYVWVLAQGKMICHGLPKDVTQDEVVIEAYLGSGAAKRLAHQSTDGKP